MSGKGDTPRPMEVDREVFSNNWDAIFNKKPPEPPKDEPTVPEKDVHS
jgi:hypothetical protein